MQDFKLSIYVEFILHLLDNDYAIKLCPNCNRTFIAKYTSKATYCNRIYNGTKATCQEYASRIQYRDKKNENPIYSLYVKCYNKLYARVRKGKLDKDSELFAKLNILRDTYMEKYVQQPSDTLIKEFSALLKEL